MEATAAFLFENNEADNFSDFKMVCSSRPPYFSFNLSSASPPVSGLNKPDVLLFLDLLSIKKSLVGSQNLVYLIFTNTTFCQRENTKLMAHILSNSPTCSSRPIRTPFKSINHASKYRIYERYHYFGANFI